MDAAIGREGVMVISVWAEGPGSANLRARITSTNRLVPGDETRIGAMGTERIVEAVRRWLDDLAGDG